MEFKIISDLPDCETIWNLLSPNQGLFDLWEFRVCFFDENDNMPHFIAGFEENQLEGIVPLCFSKSKNQYNYLGGWFPERNSFFLKDKKMLAKFLFQCPNGTFIEGIDPKEGSYYNFKDDEYTYFLDLEKYGGSFESYFASLNKKKQKNFSYEIRKIPEYKLFSNRTGDFSRLVELNIKQYDEDSKFQNDSIKNGIRKMIETANSKGMLDMTSLEINGNVEAVDIGIYYNGRYYALIGGANNQRIPGLGKLMTMLDIKNAISKGAKLVDFAATSGYWKDIWNFDREMLLKFVK